MNFLASLVGQQGQIILCLELLARVQIIRFRDKVAVAERCQFMTLNFGSSLVSLAMVGGMFVLTQV
jgi:hypothetical protein